MDTSCANQTKYPKYVDEYNFSAKVRDEGDITEKEVRALFDLWNSALATGDSKVVANRYTKVREYIDVKRQGDAPVRPEHAVAPGLPTKTEKQSLEQIQSTIFFERSIW